MSDGRKEITRQCGRFEREQNRGPGGESSCWAIEATQCDQGSRKVMSVDQTDVIDFVSTKEGSRQVTLTIADHLDWDSSWETEHLFMLQEKLNAYLRFIESGELQDAFPNAIGKEVVIEIVGKYPLSEGARVFVKNAQEVIENAGFWLAFRLFKGKDDPAAG